MAGATGILKTLGTFSLEIDGRIIRLRSRKLCCLLVYLTAEQDGSVSRSALARLFWGTHFEQQARQNLRKALSRLREYLGSGAIVTDGESVRVAAGFFDVDALTFERMIGEPDLVDRTAAIAVYQGEFLRGFEVGHGAWSKWIMLRRQALQNTMIGALTKLGFEILSRGDGATALDYAERALGLDVLREDAHRLAMSALSQLGRRADALRHFEGLTELLRREIGSAADPETNAIARRLREDRPAAATDELPASGPVPMKLSDKPSVAVLPFVNIGPDATEYLADGIVDDITTLLSRVRWLFVISRNSSFTYKGRPVDVRSVGRELGVRYLVEGSIRVLAERVRVTAQLIEVESGTNLWAGRFDADCADIFALEDELAEKIVAAIEPNLQSSETARARLKPTASLDAYDLYLRALPELYTLSEASYRKAEHLLRRAFALDPDYADALTSLAECLLRQCLNGWVSLRDMNSVMVEALMLARRAASADPRNGPALATTANALTINGQFDEAFEMAQRALHVQPNAADVRRLCGVVLVQCGCGDDAIPHFEAAMRLSPVDPRRYLMLNGITMAHFFERRFEEADIWARRAIAEMPNWAVVRRYRASLLAHLGLIDEARLEIEALSRIQPNSCLARSRTNRLRHGWMTDLLVEGLEKAGLPETEEDAAVYHRELTRE